jgi:hypothetical protein
LIARSLAILSEQANNEEEGMRTHDATMMGRGREDEHPTDPPPSEPTLVGPLGSYALDGDPEEQDGRPTLDSFDRISRDDVIAALDKGDVGRALALSAYAPL